MAGKGQVGGGPDGGIASRFGRPLAWRIRQSLELTPAGAPATMTAGDDVVLEEADGLTFIEGFRACSSIRDEPFG